MSNQGILERAIQKAIDGGWSGEPLANGWGFEDYRAPYVDDRGVWQYQGDDDWNEVDVRSFIFNHDFAKALWGDGQTTVVRHMRGVDIDMRNGWEYHLKQMVIAPDPIKYLGDHLND